MDHSEEGLADKRVSRAWGNDNSARFYGGKVQSTLSRTFTSTGSDTMSTCQGRMDKALRSRSVEYGMAFLICGYFCVVVLETDILAAKKEPPMWMEIVSWAVMGVFVLELLVRLYVKRLKFCAKMWDTFEGLLVLADLTISTVSLFLGQNSGSGAVVLRLLRLTRLARASKLLKAFPELRLMAVGLAGAMHSIVWGALFLGFTTVCCSIIAVQFIHPLNAQIQESGYYADCDRCGRAFETVMQASLTFTQQIITGDSWGTVTIPIIEHYPPTVVFFVSVFLLVGLCILNLILGVVVTVATETSDKLRKDMEAERWLESNRHLTEVFESLDKDGSGKLDKEEVMEGYSENETFRDELKKMEIHEQDLDLVFAHLDGDGDGFVTVREFADQICDIKTSSQHFQMLFIKHYITVMRSNISIEMEQTRDHIEAELAKHLKSSANMQPPNLEATDPAVLARNHVAMGLDPPSTKVNRDGLGIHNSNTDGDVLPYVEGRMSFEMSFRDRHQRPEKNMSAGLSGGFERKEPDGIVSLGCESLAEKGVSHHGPLANGKHHSLTFSTDQKQVNSPNDGLRRL